MIVPDPNLESQVIDAPDSVRLSTCVAMSESGEVVAVFVVMSDKDGKVLGRHRIDTLEEVVESATQLVHDVLGICASRPSGAFCRPRKG